MSQAEEKTAGLDSSGRRKRLFSLLVFTTVVFILVLNGIALAKNLALAYGLGGLMNTLEAPAYLVPSLL